MFSKIILPILLIVYPITIYIIPVYVTASLFLYLENPYLKGIWLLFSPVVFVLTFMLTAGVLSQTAKSAIIEGRFPRTIDHPVYGIRRLYGLCWTAVFYSGPIYYLCLAIPLFKKILFRLFGYKGSLDIVVYPDTWIRDLPLLNIEKGVYLANKSTLGTNMCLLNGKIAVGKITLKKGSMIGHMAAIGHGTTIGEYVEIGVATLVGMGVSIDDNTLVGAKTIINHFSKIGSNVRIGYSCFIGTKTVIASGIKIDCGSVIPNHTVINTQEQADLFSPSKSKISQYDFEKLAVKVDV